MKRAVIATAVGLILAYWGISLGRSLAPSSAGVVSVHSAAEEDIRFTPPPRAPASVPVSSLSAEARPIKFEFQQELDTYAVLKAIVLPNEEQKRERALLLTNSRLLKAIASRLSKQPLLELSEQDVAVDFLLDALKDGDARAAEEALRSVVADAQVEDESLERPVREQLAGVKAEILYQWSALLPQTVGQLQGLLPGPISRKIWDNVLKMQASNRAESAQLSN